MRQIQLLPVFTNPIAPTPASINTKITDIAVCKLPVVSATTPIMNGAANAVTFPENAKKPKNSLICSGGAMRARRLRQADCSGPEARPMRILAGIGGAEPIGFRANAPP